MAMKKMVSEFMFPYDPFIELRDIQIQRHSAIVTTPIISNSLIGCITILM